MASRDSVSRNLHSILPALSSALPESLVDLAASLCAQSRAKASALKPEEEVAREHICCVIAAERLKQRLNLPAIEPRPPCPPRLYKRLYKYIDASVPAVAHGPATPRKSALIARFEASPTSARNAPSSCGSPLKRDVSASGHDMMQDSHVPGWVDHAIGYVTRNLDRSSAAPHIKSAIAALYRIMSESVSGTPSKRPRLDGRPVPGRPSVSDAQLPPLIVAATILVLQRLAGPGAEFSKTSIAKAAAQDMMALKRIGISRVGTCVNEAIELLEDNADQWKKMEWYLGIPAPHASEAMAIDPQLYQPQSSREENVVRSKANSDGDLPLDANQGQDVGGEPQPESPASSDDTSSPATLEKSKETLTQPQLEERSRRKLRTTCPMMQDKFDWLNPDRRADFARWKALTLGKIARIEAEQRRDAEFKRPSLVRPRT